MPATEQDLFALLDSLGVAHTTTRHRAVFTVGEGEDLKAAMPGAHTKNLFLKDKKGAFFLVCAEQSTQIDLNALSKALGAGRVSFGNADLLLQLLGVTPGSVTIFALMNDPEGRVSLVLDEALAEADLVNFHPLTNTATTAVAPAALGDFLAAVNHPPRRVAFDQSGQPRLIEP